MRRLLKFGCATVIILAVIAGIAAALGPIRSGTTPPQQVSENIPAAQQPTGQPELPTAPASQPEPQTEQVQEAAGRCEPVPPAVVAGIQEGLTVTGGGSLRGAQAVQSRDFEQVWFVAADIQAGGLEGNSDIAVWAMDDISAPSAGLTHGNDVVNGQQQPVMVVNKEVHAAVCAAVLLGQAEERQTVVMPRVVASALAQERSATARIAVKRFHTGNLIAVAARLDGNCMNNEAIRAQLGDKR